MEVGRLTPEQLTRLQVAERNKRRCLVSHEIQGLFGLGTLKDHYGLPADDLNAHGRHNVRLRGDLVRLKIGPKFDYTIDDKEGIHEFDERVARAVEEGSLHLEFMERRTGKRFSEEVGA